MNDFSFAVSDTSKTVYEEYIPLDSAVENQFAQDCETSEQVKFYFKLPNWFTIPTPIGCYNPDWAIVFEDDRRIYFIAETKAQAYLRSIWISYEKRTTKIKCGKAHFEQFDEIEYRVINRVGQLIE